MATDVERLFVSLEARVDKFEKALAKANRTAAQRSNTIEARFAKMNKTVSSHMARLGAGISGTLVAALAPAAVVKAVKDISGEIAALAGEAKQAGVSFEAFQELRYAAEQNKIGVDALTDGLKEMQLRADEFVQTGKGPAAEAFARIGIGAQQLADGLQKPDELFQTIIGRIGELDKAAQIRISDEIFGGTGGEQFVRLMGQGADGIAQAREEARQLGLVMDEEVAAKAVEIDRKFQLLSRQVGTNLKEAIITAADALSVFIDRFKDIENRGRSSLDERMTELGMERLEVENKILALKDKQRNVTGVLATLEKREIGGTISQLEGRLQAISDEEKRILGRLDKLPSTTPPSTSGGELSFTPLPPPGDGGGKDKKRSSFDSSVESIIARTRAIEAETAAYASLDPTIEDYGYAANRARIEAELLAKAEKDGLDLKPALREQIANVAAAYAQAEANAASLEHQQAELIASMQEMRDFSRDVLSGFVDDLRAGKSASEALANSLQKVVDKLLDSAFDNLFSGALSGGLGGGGGGLLGETYNPNFRRAI